MRSAPFAVLVSASLAVVACGGGSSDSDTPTPAPSPSPTPAPTGTPAGPTITIQGLRFSPLSLQVTPGAVVTVRNLDAMLHTVTSQSAPAAYVPGAVAGVSFDTGAFLGTTTFTIPASAPIGTTVPYYCATHLTTMATANADIRIVAAAAGSAAEPAPERPPGTPY